MSDLSMTPAANAVERSWRQLYTLGAAVAIVGVTGMLLDIVLTMVPGWDTSSVPTTIRAWFAQLASSPLLGVRNLDLLNITLSLLTIPLYVALFGAQRRTNPALALLALIVVTVGTVVFATSNAALPMLELSQRYAGASSAADKLVLESAGVALLARGAHGSAGAFLGFFVSEVGTLLMAISMLTGRVFSRATAWVGIVGAGLLAVYSVAITLSPGSNVAVMALAMPAGLLMLVWNIMVARRLLALR